MPRVFRELAAVGLDGPLTDISMTNNHVGRPVIVGRHSRVVALLESLIDPDRRRLINLSAPRGYTASTCLLDPSAAEKERRIVRTRN